MARKPSINTRVIFQGRSGTVVGHMPKGMVDVKMDDTGVVERRAAERLAPAVRSNPRRRVWTAIAYGNPKEMVSGYQSGQDVVQSKMGGSNAALFTRPDPPRLSEDNKAYCGNPIDGVAYYIVVDTRRRAISHWVTTQDIVKLAKQSTAKMPGYKQVPWTPQGRMTRGEVVREFLAALPRRAAWAPVRHGDYVPLLSDFAPYYERTVQVKVIDSAGGERFLESDEDTISAGDEIYLLFPSPQRIYLLQRAFERFQKNLGYNEQLQEVNLPPRKYIRLGKGKRAQKFQGQWKQQYAKAEGRAYEADPKTVFYGFDPKTGKVSTYRVHRSASRGISKLMPFQPYGYKRITATKTGPLAQVLSASAQATREIGGKGIHPEVAQALIVSGAVAVSGQITTNPSEKVRKGQRISVWLRDKSESPFYSWVQTVVPSEVGMAMKGEPPCLTAEAQSAQGQISMLKLKIAQLRNAYQGVKTLFARVATSPTVLGPRTVRGAISRLLRAIYSFQEFMQELKQRAVRDPGSKLALDAFARTSLAQSGFMGQAQLGFKDLSDEDYATYLTKLSSLFQRSGQPGASALRFLEGAYDLHPMADVYLSVRDQLPETVRELLDGKGNMAKASSLLTPGSWGRSPENEAAWSFLSDVSALGAGFDPFSRQRVELVDPRQGDLNWALGVAIGQALPGELGRQRGEVDDEIRKEARRRVRELVLLGLFYGLLDGYALAGPLNPYQASEDEGSLEAEGLEYERDPRGRLRATKRLEAGSRRVERAPRRRQFNQFEQSVQLLDDEEAVLLGGRSSLSRAGAYLVFKTYNPALFEATHAFWPNVYEDSGFGSILAHPDLLKRIDEAGRWGFAMAETQKAALKAKSAGDISNQLAVMFTTPIKAFTSSIKSEDRMRILMRGQRKEEVPLEPSLDAMGQPRAPLSPLSLMWPLGARPDQVLAYIKTWIADPLKYLRVAKDKFARSMAELIAMRSGSLTGGKKFVSGLADRFLDTDKIQPTATFKRVEAYRASQHGPLIAALDGAIRNVEAEINRLRGQ